MKTLKLTKKDFKDTEYYYKEYSGNEDLAEFDGHLEIEGGLGWVKFERLSVAGGIFAEAGTDIEAGGGIKAGGDIEAGGGIKAGWDIEAGWGIKAGGDIKAGTGIKAGLSITCKLVLKFSYRLFAGVTVWRDINNEDKQIICGKLEGGTVCYGDVIETGLPEEKKEVKGKKVTIRLAGGEIVSGEIIE